MRENKKFKLHKALHIGAGAAMLLIALCLLFSCSNSVPEYTVTFNLNGGSLDGETSPTKKVFEGSLVSSLGEPVRDGYVFLGWYSDAEGEFEYSLETPITGNLSLYAKWAKESVTITYSYYDLKDAETKSFKGGERVSSEDLSAPSDFTGGTFLGWYYESGTAFSAETQLIDDITLYPKWENYTVYNKTYLAFSESGLRVWAEAAKTDPSFSCTLLSDITLTSSNESENTWSPIGSQGAQYTGTFDGNGHKITGLKIILVTDSSLNFIGFFGYVGSSGAVKNLNLENVNIEIDNNRLYNACSSGAIAGYSAGSIDSCIVSGTLSNSNSLTWLRTGGVIGEMDGGSISNCINNCKISSTTGTHPALGGIAGGVSGGKISGCENYGRIDLVGVGNVEGGGIAGSVNNTTVTSCFNRGNIFAKNDDLDDIQVGILALGGVVGSAYSSSSITNCKIEGCTLDATYYDFLFLNENRLFVGDFVGRELGCAVSNNEGSAGKEYHPISTSST